MTAQQKTELLKLVSDYWTLAILGALRTGEQRFCEIERLVEGVNPVTLTKRLKKLESSGLIIRNAEGPLSVSYTLTPHGQTALPILEAIESFSATVRR